MEKATAGLLVSLSPTDKPKIKKKLSFADDHGQPLYTGKEMSSITSYKTLLEKIINELPHEPPAIRSGKLDRLVERLKLTIPLDTAEKIQKPRKAFLIDFKQPMSDYIAFKVTPSLHLFSTRHKSRNDLSTSRQKSE